MAFDTQITDLVGGTIDQTACDQWAADACKEIIHQLPAKLKAKCSTVSTLNNSATTLDVDGIGDILHVTRLSADSGGYQVAVREIPALYGGLAEDSTDLNYYATVNDPVYWIDSSSDVSTLKVKPTTTASQTAVVYHITYPTVNVSAVSVVANFPDEAEYLVVLYVAIKQLHQYMNSKRSDLPSDLVLPVLELISESLPTWSAPSDFVVPVKPAVPTISSQSISDPSSFAPAYTKPVLGLRAAPTISDLSISVVSPAVPSLSAQSVTITGTAPIFTKPVRATQTAFTNYSSGLSEIDPGTFSLNAVAPAVPSLSTTSVSFSEPVPTFTKPVVGLDFAQVNTYIDTNEDIELASAKLQEIAAQLNEYSSNIQNEQVEFNKESTVYQAQLQISIQNAQFDNQEDARKLQKFQAEVSTYSTNINKEVQQYSTKLSQYQLELNVSYQAWAKTESDNISAYQADIQNETNKFNDDNVEYQAKLQKDIQDAQLSDANEARKLQKYQAEVGTYSANVNTQVQEYQQNLAGDMQVWQAERSTDLQKYSSDMQNELNEFNKENAKYQAILQEYIQEAQLLDAHEGRKLQKYQAEVGTYSSEVNTNVQTFTQALTKNRAAFDTSLQKYTSEAQKVSTSNASTLQKFQAETADYSAKLQKQGIDYQWYQGQYAALKADYVAGLAALKGTQQQGE